MRINHAPDPGFINGLERQLTSELRRRRRFGPAERSAGLKRIIRTSILLVSCAAAGVAAAKTVEHLESAKRRALHVARAETAVELSRARQGVFQDMLEEVRQRVEAGLMHADELVDAVFQSKLLEYELERAGLDLEEVRVTGEAPDNELYAPVRGGRDFVTERLNIEYQKAVTREEYIKASLARIEKLVEDGLVDQVEALQMRPEVDMAAEERAGIQGRIDLRKAFLAGDLTAGQVSLRRMVHDARARLQTAESIYHTAAAELEEVKKANADGLVSAHEVKQAEYQMISARAEFRLAKLELELLEEELEK